MSIYVIFTFQTIGVSYAEKRRNQSAYLFSDILFYNFYNPGIIPISIRKKGNDVIWF